MFNFYLFLLEINVSLLTYFTPLLVSFSGPFSTYPLNIFPMILHSDLMISCALMFAILSFSNLPWASYIYISIYMCIYILYIYRYIYNLQLFLIKRTLKVNKLYYKQTHQLLPSHSLVFPLMFEDEIIYFSGLQTLAHTGRIRFIAIK